MSGLWAGRLLTQEIARFQGATVDQIEGGELFATLELRADELERAVDRAHEHALLLDADQARSAGSGVRARAYLRDFERFAVEQRVRTWARGEPAHEIDEIAGRLRELECAVCALQRWRVAALLVILRDGFELAAHGAREFFAHELRCGRGEPLGQLAGRLFVADRDRAPRVDRTRIEPFVHLHQADPGLVIAVNDRPIDGSG